MPQFYDRVAETTISVGTSDVILAGAIPGYRRFSNTVGVGPETYYVIEKPETDEWEVGLGYLSNATTLVRNSVLTSSNANNLVAFSAGTKRVYIDVPAIRLNSHTHTQNAALAAWTITHNLGRYPVVTVVDSGNAVVYGAVDYISLNQLRVSFSAAFSGKAYLV